MTTVINDNEEAKEQEEAKIIVFKSVRKDPSIRTKQI
jgi:hypothetical protein